MEDFQLYRLKNKVLTEEHKEHISEGMSKMYAAKGGRRSPEERKHISDGMKRIWREWKDYWGE